MAQHTTSIVQERFSTALDSLNHCFAGRFFRIFSISASRNTSRYSQHRQRNLQRSFRSSWSIAIAWIIFACQNETGGVIRWFLCLPHFQPFARMSLSIFLTHRVPQIISVASIKQPIHLDPFDLFHMFLGDALLSVVIGVVVYLCIEAPFGILERQLFKKSYVSR